MITHPHRRRALLLPPPGVLPRSTRDEPARGKGELVGIDGREQLRRLAQGWPGWLWLAASLSRSLVCSKRCLVPQATPIQRHMIGPKCAPSSAWSPRSVQIETPSSRGLKNRRLSLPWFESRTCHHQRKHPLSSGKGRMGVRRGGLGWCEGGLAGVLPRAAVDGAGSDPPPSPRNRRRPDAVPYSVGCCAAAGQAVGVRGAGRTSLAARCLSWRRSRRFPVPSLGEAGGCAATIGAGRVPVSWRAGCAVIWLRSVSCRVRLYWWMWR